MARTSDTIKTARGIGRRFYRDRVRKDEAVRYALTLHPELAGYEQYVARGWNDERSGR